MRKNRSRVVIMLLLPTIIFLWIVGWSLYWIGNQKEQRHIAPHSPKQTDVILMSIMEE